MQHRANCAGVPAAGVILDAIGDPIRDYLRSRKDTTRCIVTMLTDDGEDSGAQSLLTELGNTGLAKLVRAADVPVYLGVRRVWARWDASLHC